MTLQYPLSAFVSGVASSTKMLQEVLEGSGSLGSSQQQNGQGPSLQDGAISFGLEVPKRYPMVKWTEGAAVPSSEDGSQQIATSPATSAKGESQPVDLSDVVDECDALLNCKRARKTLVEDEEDEEDGATHGPHPSPPPLPPPPPPPSPLVGKDGSGIAGAKAKAKPVPKKRPAQARRSKPRTVRRSMKKAKPDPKFGLKKKLITDPKSLIYPGTTKHNPIFFGRATVYTDLKNKVWRIKPGPCRRDFTHHSFREKKPELVWKDVVADLQRLASKAK